MMPGAVMLCICIGIDAYGWLSSSHVMQRGISCCTLIYSAPIFASTADDITTLMIIAITVIEPLMICILPSWFPSR